MSPGIILQGNKSLSPVCNLPFYLVKYTVFILRANYRLSFNVSTLPACKPSDEIGLRQYDKRPVRK